MEWLERPNTLQPTHCTQPPAQKNNKKEYHGTEEMSLRNIVVVEARDNSQSSKDNQKESTLRPRTLSNDRILVANKTRQMPAASANPANADVRCQFHKADLRPTKSTWTNRAHQTPTRAIRPGAEQHQQQPS